MSVSDSQYQLLLGRITALEEHVNDVITALSRFVSLTQVNQLLTMSQTDIQALGEQVSALETRVSELENEPLI